MNLKRAKLLRSLARRVTQDWPERRILARTVKNINGEERYIFFNDPVTFRGLYRDFKRGATCNIARGLFNADSVSGAPVAYEPCDASLPSASPAHPHGSTSDTTSSPPE